MNWREACNRWVAVYQYGDQLATGGIPLPPEHLRRHVGTARGSEWLPHLEHGISGSRAVIERFGREPAGPVLDWGCGCGRTWRWLQYLPAWREHYRGCDVDREAVEWMAAQGADVRVSGDLPPLPFADAEFAGLFGISVLTHIHPQWHAAWYAELRRVLQPGSLAFLTLHGPHIVARSRGSYSPAQRQQFGAEGWTWARRRGWHKNSACVTERFTRAAMPAAFEVLKYRPVDYGTHDSLLLRAV